jgi:hypothetical protein
MVADLSTPAMLDERSTLLALRALLVAIFQLMMARKRVATSTRAMAAAL